MSDTPTALKPGLSAPLTGGAWTGWSKWTGSEPFEDYAGPYYARREADGRFTAGFQVQPHHLNGSGAVHGGALMSFADYSLFIIATNELAGLESVTVSLSGDFVGPGPAGSILTSQGDVVKAGRSLVFVRGIIGADAGPVLSFTGVLKILRRAGH